MTTPEWTAGTGGLWGAVGTVLVRCHGQPWARPLSCHGSGVSSYKCMGHGMPGLPPKGTQGRAGHGSGHVLAPPAGGWSVD